MTRTDRVLCVAIFVLLSSAYFATASGITCSNDGSHYALARALAEEHRFTIESYDEYAEGNDVAICEGNLFSDRPPGTALIASVFYGIGGWLPSPLGDLASRHDAGNPQLLYVLLVPAWSGAGAIVLLYLTLRDLDISVFSALTTAVALALGTTHWKYSSVLFSHAPSAFLVMLSVYLVLRAPRPSGAPGRLTGALGFIVGYAVLVEYSNALLVAAVGVYLLLAARTSRPTKWLPSVATFLAGGLVPAAFLALYNTLNFGSPFALSYDYAVNYPWAGKLSETFSFPLLQGLRAMLIWGDSAGWCNPTCYNQGLFLLSPVLLLAVLGIPTYVRQARRESILTLGIFLAYLMLFSMHRTFHGFTADGRYLTPFLPLWSIPLAFLIEQVTPWTERPALRSAAYLVLYGALFLSVRNIFLHIGFSYNYDLQLRQLSNMIARPANWSYLLGQVFRNAQNLPLLWLTEVCALVIGAGIWWVRQYLTSDR